MKSNILLSSARNSSAVFLLKISMHLLFLLSRNIHVHIVIHCSWSLKERFPSLSIQCFPAGWEVGACAVAGRDNMMMYVIKHDPSFNPFWVI